MHQMQPNFSLPQNTSPV